MAEDWKPGSNVLRSSAHTTLFTCQLISPNSSGPMSGYAFLVLGST